MPTAHDAPVDSPAEPPPAANGGRERGAVARIVHKLGGAALEQGTISMLNLSAGLAALVWGLPVAWTALATGVAGVSVALLRGLALQPFLRSAATTLPLRSPRFLGAVAASVVVSGGLAATGAFEGSRELAFVTVALPAMALIEAARFAVTKRSSLTGPTQIAIAWAATLAVFAAPAVSRTTTTVVVAWVAANWVVGLAHVGAQLRAGAIDTGPAPADASPVRWTLASNNVLGQLAAHGVAIAAAGALSVATLDVVQSARLLYRPLALLAAGLPLHLLAVLVRRADADSSRRRRAEVASLSIGGLLIAAAYGIVLAIGLAVAGGLDGIDGAVLVAAAVLSGLGLSEAAIGVAMIARELERPLLVTRVVALLVGLAAFGLAAGAGMSASASLLFFSIPPALIVMLAGIALLRSPAPDRAAS